MPLFFSFFKREIFIGLKPLPKLFCKSDEGHPFINHWNIDFEETPDSYFNGFVGAEEFFIVNSLLLEKEASEDEGIKRAYVFRSWIKNLPSFFKEKVYKERIDQITPGHDFKEFKRRGGCGHLAKKSKEEWDKYKQDKSEWQQIPWQEIDLAYYALFSNPKAQLEKLTGKAIDDDLFKEFLKEKLGIRHVLALERLNDPVLERRYGCMDCHTGETAIAPRMGFSQNVGKKYSENLIELYLDAIVPKGIGQSMPKGRRPLSKKERDQFADYLRANPPQ